MLEWVVLVSRRKSEGKHRVLVQYQDAFDPVHWDSVISLHSLKVWNKSSRGWRKADHGRLIEGFTEAARWQDDKLHGLLESLLAQAKSLKASAKDALPLLLGASLLAERSNVHKSRYLDQVAQVIWAAIEIRNLAKNTKYSIEVFTPHAWIAECMADMGLDSFFSVQLIGPSQHRSKRQAGVPKVLSWPAFLLKSTLTLLKGLILLWSKFLSRSHLGFTSGATVPSNADVMFLDYFFDRSQSAEGKVKSKYWSNLPDSLAEIGRKVAFAHIFVPDTSIRTIRKARKFNRNNGTESVFIEDFIGLGEHLRATSVMIQIFGAWIAHATRQGAYQRQSGEMEILRNWEVAVSLFGTIGASHLLFEYAFQKLAKASSNSGIRKIVYVCEFQGWETLLLNNFRAYEIETIGYCHFPLRLLDARGYLPASKSEETVSAVRPDVLAVHSKMDAQRLRFRAGQGRIEIVESTRYKHLSSTNVRPRSQRPKKILVVGGYSPAETAFLVMTCEKALEVAPKSYSLTFLSHPNASVEPKNFPTLKRDPARIFSDLLCDFDAVVVAPETSGAMEALMSGMKVVIVAEAGRLVASPVYGLIGVEIVSEAKDLFRSLAKVDRPKPAQLTRFRPLTPGKKGFILWSDLLKVPEDTEVKKGIASSR